MIDSFSLMTFNDVKVFAGKIGYLADASYKNLLWENLQVPRRIVGANKFQLRSYDAGLSETCSERRIIWRWKLANLHEL